MDKKLDKKIQESIFNREVTGWVTSFFICAYGVPVLFAWGQSTIIELRLDAFIFAAVFLFVPIEILMRSGILKWIIRESYLSSGGKVWMQKR